MPNEERNAKYAKNDPIMGEWRNSPQCGTHQMKTYLFSPVLGYLPASIFKELPYFQHPRQMNPSYI
jgi:hypothetical protein